MSSPRYYWYRIVEQMISHVAQSQGGAYSDQEKIYRAAAQKALREAMEQPEADDRIYCIYSVLLVKSKTAFDLIAESRNNKPVKYLSDFVTYTGIIAGWPGTREKTKRRRPQIWEIKARPII